ncbi:hypothetical protein BH10BAC1_BH10BAC1_13300 [soil metagenome]
MKKQFRYFIYLLFLVSLFSSCTNYNYRKLLTDEVVLKDGNSQTGTIVSCDSSNLKIKKIDESISIIPWTTIDTVQGKKLKTIFFGADVGIYKVPYFSVFRNESITPTQVGAQYKLGYALRGTKLYYFHLTVIPAKPYSITKFGFGYQYYMGQTTYLKKNAFYVGVEANLMGVQYNNGPQFTFEPFTGYERKCSDRIRMHAKLGLQLNFSSKNNQTGINFTIGAHFMNRNFSKYYKTLNAEHKQLRK